MDDKANLKPRAIVWHRRDLRLDDNAAIHHCIDAGFEPIGAFIFDSHILASLPKEDRRVDFIHASVESLAEAYAKMGLDFFCIHGLPEKLIPMLAKQCSASMVYANRDYEPYAKDRDHSIGLELAREGRALSLSKDHIVFEASEILTLAKTNFAVFTPYKNAWLKSFEAKTPRLFKSRQDMKNLGFKPREKQPIPTLTDMGFASTNLKELGVLTGEKGGQDSVKKFTQFLDAYASTRDFPHLDSTSRLGIHLRFGTVSIRRLALWASNAGSEGAKVWLSELIWRDFYSTLLDLCPRLAQGESYQKKYDTLSWSNDEAKLAAWMAGSTGYPIVDAGMRELATTGHMHNRVRMIVASFLAKHLDCDWRLGEAHFAKHLLDYDFASNNGGWQWSASTGCDAQPYFRIFNPYSQSERFDPQGLYIKKWVPELAQCPDKHIHMPSSAKPDILAQAQIVIGHSYPAPIVEHASARAAALAKYASAAGA